MIELLSSQQVPCVTRLTLFLGPWPHVSRSDLDCEPCRHLQSPEQHSWLQVFAIHPLLTCLWWGRPEIKSEVLTSRQVPFRANRIGWLCTHEMNTYSEPLPSCLFYKSHPANDPFSRCVAKCYTMLVFQSHDFLHESVKNMHTLDSSHTSCSLKYPDFKLISHVSVCRTTVFITRHTEARILANLQSVFFLQVVVLRDF